MHVFRNYIQQFGRFQRNARLYLICSALSGVPYGISAVIYNLYLVSLGYDTDFIGFLLLAGTLGAGIAIFPAGLCVDRFSGKWILIWSSVVIGIAGAGQILFRDSLPLLISSFVVGVAGAFIIVINAPYLTANSTPDERPHLFSLNIVVLLITSVVGQAMGGALPIWFRSVPFLMEPLPIWCNWLLASDNLSRSYQLTLLLAGAIAAPSFVPLFCLSDERLRSVETMSNHKPWRERVVENVVSLRTLQPRKVISSALFVLITMQVLVGLGAGLFLPYFNIFFVKQLGASSALFGLLDAAANTLHALCVLSAPWIAQRFGQVATIVVPRLFSIPVMLMIGISGNLPLAATFYPIRQGLMDLPQGILQVFSMEAVPEHQRGLANSSFQASYQVAWALSASLGGVIIARFGYVPVFCVAAVLYTISTLLFWVKFRRQDVQGEQDNMGENKQIPSNDANPMHLT